jgi:hypothetical protein
MASVVAADDFSESPGLYRVVATVVFASSEAALINTVIASAAFAAVPILAVVVTAVDVAFALKLQMLRLLLMCCRYCSCG